MELELEKFRYLSRRKQGGKNITISKLKDIWVLEFEVPYEFTEVHYYDDYSDLVNKVSEITDDWRNVWENGKRMIIDIGEGSNDRKN